MAALEAISGFVTAPGTTLTANTPASGDSFTVRNAALENDIYLLNLWAHNQGAGEVAIRSPELHDNTQGIRINVNVNSIVPSLPYKAIQKLIPQSDLTFLQSGSATAGDIETFVALLFYSNLPGIDARLITYDEFLNRVVEYATLTNNITSTPSGNWSNPEPINVETDILKSNMDYAIIGNTTDNPTVAVGYRGADLGNLRVAIPSDSDFLDLQKDFFLRLARLSGLPTIPVISSNNADNVLVDLNGNENAVSVRINTLLGRLS